MTENTKEEKKDIVKKEEKNKIKKEKKKKENKVRPKTPYLIYWMETRLNVKQELIDSGKDTKPSQLTKEIAKRWNELSNEEKNIYKKKADTDKDIKDENKDIKENNNDENENKDLDLKEFSIFAFFAFFTFFAMFVLFVLYSNSNSKNILPEFKVPLIIVDKINYFYNASTGIGKQIAIPSPTFWNMIKNMIHKFVKTFF